jgi:antirestriction protein ArdC
MLQAKAEEERLKRDHDAMEAEKNRQRDILIAEIRAAGMGSMVDINQNLQSDYLDAMRDIRQEQTYQDQTNLEREKEANRNSLAMQKNDLEREKLQAQKEIADKQLQIARENKNKYDNKSSDKKKE